MRQEIKDLSVEEYLDAIRRRLLNTAAMVSAYKSWSDDFSRKEILESWTDGGYQPWERKVTLDEIKAIDSGRLSELGFSRWDENLRCIPLWAWNYIEDGCSLTSITGDVGVKGTDDIDLDVRFGCIAWGFLQPDTQRQLEEPSGDEALLSNGGQPDTNKSEILP